LSIVVAFVAGWLSSAKVGSRLTINGALVQYAERSSFVAKCLKLQRTDKPEQLQGLLEMSLNHSLGGVERMIELGGTLKNKKAGPFLDGLSMAATEAEILGRTDEAKRFEAAQTSLKGAAS
jgi:hypothetical protein